MAQQQDPELQHNPILDLEKAREIGQELLDKYKEHKSQLERAIQEKKEREQKGPKILTVIVSLYDENESLLSAKMFEHSFRSLLEQANAEGIRLDFIVVANNSGGKTPEIAEGVKKRLVGLFQSTGDVSFGEYQTQQPETVSPTTPWGIPNLSLHSAFETKHRVSLVTQPAHHENRGKLRALRDVLNLLFKEILEGYLPRYIFQMDAETILEFAQQEHTHSAKSPLGVLLHQLENSPETLAVGSKDKFAIMDEGTGKPTDKRIPLPQEGYLLLNERRPVTVPGGAAMVRVADYVAAMRALVETVWGDVAEDYLLTRLLRWANGGEEKAAYSLSEVTHLNRCPEAIHAAIAQMDRWRGQAIAADAMIPGPAFDTRTYIDYFFGVARKQIQEILRHPSIGGISHLLKGLLYQRELYRLVARGEPRDPQGGDPSWGRGQKRE